MLIRLSTQLSHIECQFIYWLSLRHFELVHLSTHLRHIECQFIYWVSLRHIELVHLSTHLRHIECQFICRLIWGILNVSSFIDSIRHRKTFLFNFLSVFPLVLSRVGSV
jgi:hypothetical protein